MSDYFDPGNGELLADFFAEAGQQVEALEQNILVLEREGANRDAIDELFRAAHTLKGGAATVEMPELARFCHLAEDALDGLRSGSAAVTAETADALLAAVDIIKAMLERRSAGEVYGEDTSGTEARLHALLEEGSREQGPGTREEEKGNREQGTGSRGEEATVSDTHEKSPGSQRDSLIKTPLPAPRSPSPTLTEYEALELREAASGLPVYRVTVAFDGENPMKGAGGLQVFTALGELGEVLHTVPGFEEICSGDFPSAFQADYYIASESPPAKIKRYALIAGITVAAEVEAVEEGSRKWEKGNRGIDAAVSHTTGKSPGSQKDSLTETPLPTPRSPLPATPKPSPSADSAHNSLLRVESRRIDDLLNLVSETVITKATFNQISMQFGSLLGEFRSLEAKFREEVRGEKHGGLFPLLDGFGAALKADVGKLRSTAENLGRITGELQEGVMRIRMVPIAQIFNRFPRVVRDLSRDLGKKINLVIEGEDTELDKSVIEDILDPVMHTVRNAADHGIEAPEARRAAGKSEEGRVLLRAANEGNMIVIEIADDGRGIDVEAVKEKAVQRGLVSAGKALTDAEAFALIFEPGFSTAREVTSISGRGVGLDVVRRQIEKLNGAVTVRSEKGQGTRFTIKLPLTLAIIQGLLVRVGPEIYSIPITQVIESVRLAPGDIRMIDNYEVFNIRSEVLSLLRLGRLFGIADSGGQNFVVIAGSAEKKMGFMVDSLIGEEDVVIKPLKDRFTSSPGIAGASILGDGSVSLILDVSQLLELGLKREAAERREEFVVGS